MEHCENCRFWEGFYLPNYPAEKIEEIKEAGDAAGWCRRYPPSASGSRSDSLGTEPDGFPKTCYDDWCGEWKPKQES